MIPITEKQQPFRLAHFSLRKGPPFLKARIDTKPVTNSDLERADRFIEDVASMAFPRRKDTAGLLNEATLLDRNPIRMKSILGANGTVDTRLKFEINRKIMLAGLSQELTERSDTFRMRNELNEIHELLDSELFVGKIGQTYPQTTYAVINRATNDVTSVHDSYPLFVRPDRCVKKFNQQMRYVDDVGYVLSAVREKTIESSLIKSLRRAVLENNKSGEDSIDTIGTVKDTMGLQFVVKNTMESKEPRVNVLREKVVAIIKKRYGDITIIENGKRKGAPEEVAQSPMLNYQRLLIQVPQFPIPFEIMFFGEGDYISNKYHVGKKDRKTKTYEESNAHDMYGLRRIRQILPIIYPEAIENQPIEGYLGLNKEIKKTINNKAKELRKANRIKPREVLPEALATIRKRKTQKDNFTERR